MSSPGNPGYQQLTLVPVTLREAKRFVGSHHRHNLPPVTWKWGVGLTVAGSDDLVAVAMASLPVARGLNDGRTLEVQRVCSVGVPNACSMLYGAITRAAKALGYRRLVTYTLASEPGSSLRASGWTKVGELDRNGRPEGRRGWNSGPRFRVEVDLFGNERAPMAPKIRWEKALVG
jgi:hypothetical protein